jgi:hypothetical protein
MTEYTELQIIKHALNYYIKRPEATVKDVNRELRLLNKIETKVENLKGDYGIE